MATSLDSFWGSANQDSGSVPPVDPADIRSVWTMQSEVQARNPGQQIGIAADAYKRACGPDADVRAVFEWVSLLGLLQMGGMLSPWLHDGVPDDAVFHVAARIPMSRMQRDIVYNKPPFDVDEFIKQVEERFGVGS
jgi:hypothetical protein